MGVPAIPNYLGKQLSDSAPGHSFTLYFPLWQGGSWLREVDKAQGKDGAPATGKTPASLSVTKLPPHSSDLMKKLAERQQALATPLESTGQLLRLEAKAVAPFATGLGIEHPLENGFSFLNPYGLPYLPGSGVKGVLRAAARELANGIFGSAEGWTFDAIEALFGRLGEDGDTNHQRGALSFWDVIPLIEGNSLKVEVMTPHQSHYYQKGESPHESGSPNPITFLTVPPGSGFTFHVQCNRPFLIRIAPPLAESDAWKTLLEAAFKHAFDWLGFGAKSAVGYGAMRSISPEEQAMAVRVQLRCSWVDDAIASIAKKNNIPDNKIDDVLRGKLLAEAWRDIADADLKAKALRDIQSRWQEKTWWDAPPPGVATKSKAIYQGG